MERSRTKQAFDYCGLITLLQHRMYVCMCVCACVRVCAWAYLIKQFPLQQVTSFECIWLENQYFNCNAFYNFMHAAKKPQGLVYGNLNDKITFKQIWYIKYQETLTGFKYSWIL